jgi:hypothetical protein
VILAPLRLRFKGGSNVCHAAHVRKGSRLRENPDAELARRKFCLDYVEQKKNSAVCHSQRRKREKTILHILGSRTFHTAWVISEPSLDGCVRDAFFALY